MKNHLIEAALIVFLSVFKLLIPVMFFLIVTNIGSTAHCLSG